MPVCAISVSAYRALTMVQLKFSVGDNAYLMIFIARMIAIATLLISKYRRGRGTHKHICRVISPLIF